MEENLKSNVVSKPSTTSSTTSSMESSGVIVIGTPRLPRAKEIALNEMLRRYGGEDEGMPIYKISWAAEDNSSLAKSHTCGRSDPFDWQNCDCPRQDPLKTPLCFHEMQTSYHLLSWEPPSPSMQQWEREMKVDMSKGQYSCLMHFVDTQTGKPFDPTQYVLEIIVPILLEIHTASRAARHGMDAVVQRERTKKINREHARQAQEEKNYSDYADRVLGESAPAFGGESFITMSGSGEKRRQSSEVMLSDLPRQAPVAQPKEFGVQFRVVPVSSKRRK